MRVIAGDGLALHLMGSKGNVRVKPYGFPLLVP